MGGAQNFFAEGGYNLPLYVHRLWKKEEGEGRKTRKKEKKKRRRRRGGMEGDNKNKKIIIIWGTI